ncbi:MAG TPA: amidohydrolase family protein, partial [Bacillota bacterium]|nr:amidohydrolase family protein [Bacillota bacterium]
MLTAISNVKIYAPQLHDDCSVVVFDENGIKHVGSDIPAQFEVDLHIDGSGCSLTPGLIDSHVHITMDPDPDPWPKLQESDAMIVLRGARNALSTLTSGFTTLRDMGAKNHVDIALRNAIRQGLVPGPRLLVSGKCLCMTGGHGWMMGREVDSPDEARKGAREQLKAT